MRLGPADHSLTPPIINDTFHRFCTRSVKTVKGTRWKVTIKLGTVGGQGTPETVEHLDRQPAWIAWRLHHDRRHCGHQHRLSNPAPAVSRNVARDFAAARGMADMDGVAEIQMLDDRDCVGSVMVHVVSVGHLTRASVAAPVDSYNAVPLADKEQHLGVPVVGAERPAVVEDNRLAAAPVLVEDLDAVLGCNRAHNLSSLGLSSLILEARGYPTIVRLCRLLQSNAIDRHLAQTLASGGKDRVGHCRDDERSSALAHSAWGGGTLNDVDFDSRGFVHPQHLVRIEVGLLDTAVLERDLAMQRRGDAEDDCALYLRLDGIGIDGGAAVHRTHDAADTNVPVLRHPDFGNVGHIGREHVLERHPAAYPFGQGLSPAGLFGGEIKNRFGAGGLVEKRAPISDRILLRRRR